MGGGIDVGVALVVLKRDRTVGDAEFEGAEGAVIVLPAAVIVIEIVPDELLDRGFEADFIDWRVRVFRGELYFAEGWQRDLFIGGVPRLDALDLAGIVAAVVLDGHAVDAGFGEGGKNQVLVVDADNVTGAVGLGFGRRVHGCLPVFKVIGGRVKNRRPSARRYAISVRKYASGRRGTVERGAGGLVFGEKSRQVG